MFLTDFRMRKYTGGIISRVGIFLTVTPVTFQIRMTEFVNTETHESGGENVANNNAEFRDRQQHSVKLHCIGISPNITPPLQAK